MKMRTDAMWMKQALELARRGEGLTRPNPPVGAILVRRGKSVGQGFHARAGKSHAEALAIDAAGRNAAGSTLYVTLEPCCTTGKTPPCTELIIRSGIKRVVVSARDPNPAHRGKGLRLLMRNGVEVVEDILSDEGRRLILPFSKWITAGRPFVTLKLAVSLDGRIADRHGASRWITGPASRGIVHDMRRRADAVLVGAGTVLADDPSLLPRPAKGRKPFRVIFDAKGRVKPGARILSDRARARTIIATTRACPVERRDAWRETGASVWTLRGTERGVSPAELMKKMAGAGILHVLCEGGSETASSLIRAGLVDELVFFVAPRIIGGTNAKGAVGGHGWKLDAAPELVFTEHRNIGADIMIRASTCLRD